MKKIHTVLSGLLVLASSVAVSCNSESPARQCADIYKEMAVEISAVSDDTAAIELLSHGKQEWVDRMDKVLTENESYELTDDDKAALKESLKEFIETSLRKSMELTGEKPENVEAASAPFLDMMSYQIDNAKTLGDLKSKVKF